MPHRTPIALLVAGVAASVLAGAAPASGTALTTCSPSHCYGLANMNRTTHGATEDLTVSCLSIGSTSSNFVTEEMWVGTDNQPSGTYWVEEGMAYGNPQGDRRYWYWADSRPNGGGYHEHDLTSHSASLNTTYISTITYAGSNTWNVYEHGGTPLGKSTSNPAPSSNMQVGEETTNTTATASALHSTLYYKDTSDNFHASWPGATLSSHSPPTAAWKSTANSVWTYSNCARTAAAAPATAPATAPAATPTAPPTTAALLATARGFAARSGDASPALSYVASTRSAASATLTGSPVVDRDGAVLVVSMVGHFVGTAAKVPNGTPAPTGRNLTVVLDRATGLISDWGITPGVADLAPLGRVTTVS